MPVEYAMQPRGTKHMVSSCPERYGRNRRNSYVFRKSNGSFPESQKCRRDRERKRRGTFGNDKCGDIMRIYLDIDEESHVIRDCKFKTFGCGAAVATSSMATELVKGKTIEEAMQVTNKAVMEALDGLPAVKVHCSLLAEEAIHAALWDYAQKHEIRIEGLDQPKSDISEHDEDEEY